MGETESTGHASEAGDASGKVLYIMLVALVLAVCAAVIFGYAAVIVMALLGTAAMLVTLVVLTAGR